MKRPRHDSILRRWGFYVGNRLAFAGVACRAGKRAVELRVVETRSHAQTAPLPQRIGLEQQIRACVRSDIERAMGAGWSVSIRFDPRKLDERLLARDFFRTALSPTASDA